MSYTGIKALGVLHQTKVATAKSDTMNREANINFYKVFMGFYKFCVTDETMPANSQITVQDILQSPHFKDAKVIAGHIGLHHQVKWVHIMEMTKYAAQYLRGQELILSNGIGLEQKEKALSYIEDLISRHISGLCIAAPEDFPGLSDEIIKLANDHSFPLIIIAETTPFLDVTQEFDTRIINNNTNNLSLIEKFSHKLNTVLLSTHDLEDILYCLHTFLNLNVVYIPIQEKPIFMPPLASGEQNKVLKFLKNIKTNSSSFHNMDTPIKPDSYGVSSIIVLNQNWGELYIFSPYHEITETETLILDKCAQAISQSLLQKLYIKEKQIHEENRWINDWLNNKLTNDEIIDHLKNLDALPDSRGYVVCLVNFDTQNNTHKPLREFMFHMTYLARSYLEQQGFYLLTSFENSQIKYLLINNKPQDTWKKRINIVINQIKEITSYKNLLTHKINIIFGIGKMVNEINQVHKSFENARDAVNIQKKLKLHQPLYETLHIYRILTLLDKQCNLQELALDYLTPVLEYDKKNHTQLLHTLKTYYQCHGSKQETAKKLYIARQTLYQRLQKLEELVGGDFMSSEKRLTLEIVLFAYEFHLELRIEN